MNLSDINPNLKSHPKYPYFKHIKNIMDTFKESAHKKAGFYHDVGKLTQAFQKYIRDVSNSPKTTHSFVGALYFLLKNNFKLNSENFAIYYSILRHHSDLKDVNSYAEYYLSDEDSIKSSNPNLKDKLVQINTNLNSDMNIKKDFFSDFCDMFDHEYFSEDYNINNINNYFLVRETFSKLIFADKHEAIFHDKYDEGSNFKPQKHIDLLLKILNNIEKNKLSDIRNKAREEVIKKYINNKDNFIFVIEAPTGLGKTFIALHLALEIARNKSKTKIINGLPMTSIIDQTHKEYLKIFPKNELLKYHYLTSYKDYSKEEESLGEHENAFTSRSWAFDNVIVTTFNQIFNCFFSNKNRDLIKLWTLRNSVIILDEIQYIPRILLQDIANIINYLSKNWNIDFILMSATIPAIKKFLEPNLVSNLLDNKYFSDDMNKKYTIIFNPQIDTIKKITNKIIEKEEKNNSILCVVNTKKTALNIFNRLTGKYKNGNIFLLSTYLIPKRRNSTLLEIRTKLANNEKIILISTQVVEAGVDLDFDTGIREFAPFYSIIQAAGRVNREKKKEIAEFIVTEKIGYSPYNQKDMLRKEVGDLIKKPIISNNILKYIKKYFEITIGKTTPDSILFPEMERLDFETTYKSFSEYFMPNIPGLKRLFIEIEEGLFNKFWERYSAHINGLKQDSLSLKSKMSIIEKMKEVYKEMSPYIIQVPFNDVLKIDLNEIWSGSEVYLLEYFKVKSDNYYSSKKGWVFQDDDSGLFF